MDATLARIPTASQREAMDWGLVLVSQGIESTIAFSEEEQCWTLLVSPAQIDAALQAIGVYRWENRHWGWRRSLVRPGIIFDWSSLGWGLLLILFFLVDAGVGLKDAGMVDSKAIAHGQWWRCFTAMWLHEDIGHLTSNIVIGVPLLGFSMGRFGAGVGLLVATLCGAAANVAACLLSSEIHRSLGASGLVMACLGLLAAESLWLLYRTAPKLRYVLGGSISGAMLFVLLGLAPGTDIVAHAAGFAFGVLAGALLGGMHSVVRKPVISSLCGLGWTILTILPWWLALRK